MNVLAPIRVPTVTSASLFLAVQSWPCGRPRHPLVAVGGTVSSARAERAKRSPAARPARVPNRGLSPRRRRRAAPTQTAARAARRLPHGAAPANSETKSRPLNLKSGSVASRSEPRLGASFCVGTEVRATSAESSAPTWRSAADRRPRPAACRKSRRHGMHQAEVTITVCGSANASRSYVSTTRAPSRSGQNGAGMGRAFLTAVQSCSIVR